MTSALVQKLTGVRDLKKILETTVKELGETYGADTCQIMLSNPLDPNVTAICEYRASQDENGHLPGTMFPLTLQGKALGQLSLARGQEVGPEEVNSIRVTLAELGDIIRHAQINDIVQRDTFRDTFLVEIGNVMAYSLGIGDALFMVVNILGKVLQCSRCIFICTDDSQAGWKCYEFWQQDKVQSCQDFRWPTTDSPIVAQTLLASSPNIIYEGQQNSYVTPVQEEMQFIGVKSLLGVALRTAVSTHGAVILQQCDHRRAWTRGEIDMVQNVADKVAEALAKLPAEKRVREPIMQLHQRTVEVPEDQKDLQSVRRSLKSALGAQAIPVAQKTSAPKPPAPAPAPAAAPAPAPAAAAIPPPPPPAQPPPPMAPAAEAQGQQAGKSLNSILGGIKKSAATSAMAALDFGAPTQPEMPPGAAPGGDQPGGAWGEPPPAPAPTDAWGSVDMTPSMPPQPPVAPPANAWGDLDSIPAPGSGAAAPPAGGGAQWGNLDSIPTPGAGAAAPAAGGGQWGSLDSIPTPGGGGGAAPAADSQWGNLDAIPTPASGPGKAGLGGAIMAKPRGAAPASPLLASFHKDKSKYTEAMPKTEFVEGPPVEIDEAAAQAKFQQILSSSNPTSDYIFATAGLDARMLGRIDGWVSQIEQKDKYTNGHARQVAEYSVAIAKQAGMPQQEIDLIRLAALVHDVGKMGAAPQVLQKPDEELSDAELLLMMKHPLDGAELLESFPDLKHLAPIVRAHHEEYDGNGYPAGLKGEEIPVAARIIHVANSYHSMISPLRFRQGISPTEAQQNLTKGAGKQWDPRFVEALILSIMQQQVPAAL